MNSKSNVDEFDAIKLACEKDLETILSVSTKSPDSSNEILLVLGDCLKNVFEEEDKLCAQMLAQSIVAKMDLSNTKKLFLELENKHLDITDGDDAENFKAKSQRTKKQKTQASPPKSPDAKLKHARDKAKNDIEYLNNRFTNTEGNVIGGNSNYNKNDREKYNKILTEYNLMVKKVKHFRSIIYQLIGLNKLEMDQLNALENLHSPDRNSTKSLNSPQKMLNNNQASSIEKGLHQEHIHPVTTPRKAETFVTDFVEGNDLARSDSLSSLLSSYSHSNSNKSVSPRKDKLHATIQ